MTQYTNGLAIDRAVITSGSLNDVSFTFSAIYNNNVSFRPSTDNDWYYVRTTVYDSNTATQEAINVTNGRSFVRIKQSASWKEWMSTSNLILPQNSSYNYRGLSFRDVRGAGQIAIMSNAFIHGGIINFAYNTNNASEVYIQTAYKGISNVKFYKDEFGNFYIIAATSGKWDAISYIGGTVAQSQIITYQSNNAAPSGATEITPSAFPSS